MTSFPHPPLVREPNISGAKVLASMRRRDITQRALATHLGVSEFKVSRGLKNQQFLRSHISKLTDLLMVDPSELMNHPKGNDGTASVQRLCGSPVDNAWPIPTGATIEMLRIGDTFHLYLVGPSDADPQTGDYVILTERSGRVLVGQLRFNADNPAQWIVMAGKKNPTVTVVDRTEVGSVRLVVSVLGWAWGVQ